MTRFYTYLNFLRVREKCLEFLILYKHLFDYKPNYINIIHYPDIV